MTLEFAQKAVLYRGGNILLVQKSAKDPYHPLRWEIPGGRLKTGESLDEHIKREVREEVGLEIAVGPPLAVWSWVMGTGADARTVIAVSRLCHPLTLAVSLKGNDADDFLGSWQWLPARKVPELDLIPDSREAILESIELLLAIGPMIDNATKLEARTETDEPSG